MINDWRNVALLASLALNLLVAGMVASHLTLEPPRRERYSGPAYSDILPRKFFMSLGEERRKALGERFAGERQAYREGRRGMRAAAMKVADALKAEPYDGAATTTALGSYETIARGLIDRGAILARQLVANLTPEERTLLADSIRERAEQRRKAHAEKKGENGKAGE